TFTAQDEGFRKLVSAADVYRSVQGGLATTKAMLTEQPELVTKVVRAMMKAIRLIKSDRKYGIEFIKGPWLDIGKEAEKIAARVYDIAGPALLENGSVSEDIQRQMIADAAVRIKPNQPVVPEQVCDFTIVRRVSEALREFQRGTRYQAEFVQCKRTQPLDVKGNPLCATPLLT